MADNNLRSSRSRDPSSRDPGSLDPIARGGASRDAAGDPLAELARLIGRSDTPGEQRHNLRDNQPQAAENRASTEGANWRAGGRSAPERLAQERLAQERLAQERLAQERLAQERLAQERHTQERHTQERLAQERLAQERFAQERERYAKDRYAGQGESADDHRYAVPPTSEPYPSAQADPHGDFADDLPPPVRHAGRGGHFGAARDPSRGARFADDQAPPIADPRHAPPAFFGEPESDQDEPNDLEYGGGDGEAYAAEDGEEEYDEYYEDDEENPYPRRGGTKVLTAVLGLAILATAGAFGYRTIFNGSVMPSLPPIIKPADGPTKIKPSHDAQTDAAKGGAVTDEGADTKLVTHEEQPVDIPPPQDGPHVVSTVPVFPDPTSPSPSAGDTGFPPAQFPRQSSSSTSTVTASAAPDAAPPKPAPAAVPTSPTPRKIHTVAIRAPQAGGAAAAGAPLPLGPAPAARTHTASAAESAPAETPASRLASAAESETSAAPAPGYDVQVTSQRSEADAKTEFQTLQAKFPSQLGSRNPIIRRADLGAKGVYYRALVGPFASAEEAAGMCSSLKAAGGSCLVQRN
ncbi:MAG TPA: SPOR domain-containing protein [Xanthobacteraceae bacterium]